ncbi:MAG: hypothetical protein H7A45_04760 [Verrucomicrobiales bacterium]|nr:hypothetical protein [Verrucomicrobiales bacterium]MCP5527685.1 hypothetical protein [Verrucomicrobiales bacterium]
MKTTVSLMCLCVLSAAAQVKVVEPVAATSGILEKTDIEIKEALAGLDAPAVGLEEVHKALQQVLSLSSRGITDAKERALARDRILHMRLRIWAGVKKELLSAQSEVEGSAPAVIRIYEPMNLSGEAAYVDRKGTLVTGNGAWAAYERDVAENGRLIEQANRQHALELLCDEARAHATALTVTYLRDAAGRESVYKVVVDELKEERIRVMYLEELVQSNPSARGLLKKEHERRSAQSK